MYRVDSLTFDSSFKATVGAPKFFIQNPSLVGFQWGDSSLIMAGQSNDTDAKPLITNYVVGTDGNLVVLGQLPSYFTSATAEAKQQYVDQVLQFTNDGQGNLLLFYQKACISVDYKSFTYNNII